MMMGTSIFTGIYAFIITYALGLLAQFIWAVIQGKRARREMFKHIKESKFDEKHY